ncbi:unnamed protein product [Trichobilharzia szidati]|nr:unnamed protein product [Trichobilharzia szidati]
MVYFTYSQVAFVTLLAFTTINEGESTNVTKLAKMLNETENEISGIISELKSAKSIVQIHKDKLLSQNESLRGFLEDHIKCLEFGFELISAQRGLESIIDHLTSNNDGTLDDTIKCCKEELAVYDQKNWDFRIDNECFNDVPSSLEEEFHQLAMEVEEVFIQKKLFSMNIFYKNLYTTQMKVLKGY